MKSRFPFLSFPCFLATAGREGWPRILLLMQRCPGSFHIHYWKCWFRRVEKLVGKDEESQAKTSKSENYGTEQRGKWVDDLRHTAGGHHFSPPELIASLGLTVQHFGEFFTNVIVSRPPLKFKVHWPGKQFAWIIVTTVTSRPSSGGVWIFLAFVSKMSRILFY